MPQELLEEMYSHGVSQTEFAERAINFLLNSAESFFRFYGLRYDRATLHSIYIKMALR